MNKKRCQIRAGLPITCFTVPIVGTVELNLTHDEIYKCLCAKAEVIEILGDGTRIHLDFTNYNKNNYWVDEDPIGEPHTEETPDSIVDIAYNYINNSIESTTEVSNIEDTDKLGKINAIEDSLESIICAIKEEQIAEEVEESTIIPQFSEVKETVEEEPVGEITTAEEIKVETPVTKTVTATTVSNYQVASRNNNKKKNNNHKK